MRRMFQQIFPHHKHFAVMAPMAPLGWMHHKVAGYPMGGSAKIIGLLKNRYKSLGGTIEFNKEAKTINIENNRARSIVCIDGRRYGADIIVSTADPYATINTLFGGAYLTDSWRKKFETYLPFSALVQVGLGIARTFEHEPEKLNTPLPRPLVLGTETTTDMMVRILNFDPSYAPQGKTSVIVQLRTHDYSYWEKLRKSDNVGYGSEKKRVAGAVIDALEKRFGNIKSNIEVVDIATPATYLRYCNLYKGAHQGWAPIPGVIGRPQPKMLKGLKDFYMAGQWCSPAGGIPAVIAIARQVTQIICKNDKKKFKANA
jgi:phytoene dehydrogenase-like protein